MKLKIFIKWPYDIKKEIIPPDGGWKEQTYYKVEASFSRTNPVSEYLFYTGFINDGRPAVDNRILNTEDYTSISDVYYMKALGELTTKEES